MIVNCLTYFSRLVNIVDLDRTQFVVVFQSGYEPLEVIYRQIIKKLSKKYYLWIYPRHSKADRRHCSYTLLFKRFSRPIFVALHFDSSWKVDAISTVYRFHRLNRTRKQKNITCNELETKVIKYNEIIIRIEIISYLFVHFFQIMHKINTDLYRHSARILAPKIEFRTWQTKIRSHYYFIGVSKLNRLLLKRILFSFEIGPNWTGGLCRALVCGFRICIIYH